MSEALALDALLAHPANGGLLRIAGPENGLWRDVEIVAREPELPRRVDGALAVLTSTPPGAAWQQDALVRRVRDRGFTALALPGASTFGTGTRALAARLGLAILECADPMALAKACWQLLESRDALTLAYVRKVAQSFEYPADGLADLLRHLAANVGHGIALVDAEGVLLEAGGRLAPETHAAIGFGSWVDLARAGVSAAASVRIDSPIRSGLRIAFFDEGLGEVQLRALAVAAEVAMPAVAARILIDEVAAVSDASVSSGLLRDFVDLRGAPDADVERRMLERGWRTSGYHLGFRLVGRSRLDAYQLLRFVTGALGAVDADTHVTTAGRGVSGWATFAEPPTPDRIEVVVAALRGVHGAARRAFDVAMGVGSVQGGTTGLTSTLSEAGDAARIAVNRSTTGWFVRVDGLGLEQLLLAWTGNDTFLPAAESLLAPLSDELLETLTAYLDHESGIAATAAALELHRNTVSARVQRAQELLGVDMDDPEVRLALHLACRVARR